MAVADKRLAQRHFLDATDALAALQLGQYIIRRELIVGQRHQGVKPQVGP